MIFTAIAGKFGSWLLGGGIAAIGQQLRQAQKDRLDARNETERLDADIRIKTLEGQQAVLIAEQGNWVTRWIRPAFALPFVLFNMKVIIWDKMLGWGVTDDLSPQYWQLQMVIFGAYFLTRPFEKRRRK